VTEINIAYIPPFDKGLFSFSPNHLRLWSSRFCIFAWKKTFSIFFLVNVNS
jgi:hypothetical protein